MGRFVILRKALRGGGSLCALGSLCVCASFCLDWVDVYACTCDNLAYSSHQTHTVIGVIPAGTAANGHYIPNSIK